MNQAGRFILLLLISCWSSASGQDLFEIHVYEYEPLRWREYSLEAHLNLTAQGRALPEGTLLPTDRQTHLTLEPTIGLSQTAALGFMVLSAWQPGYPAHLAGWRVLPHLYAPSTWRLPFQLGFVAEFSFQNTHYEENQYRVELRPIIDWDFDRWQFVFNPVLERALRGPGTARSWNFEPAVLIRRKRRLFSPSIEYYGEIDSLTAKPRAQPQVHQVYVGGDWRFTERFSFNFGFGSALAHRGPGIMLKSRAEWDWHRPSSLRP